MFARIVTAPFAALMRLLRETADRHPLVLSLTPRPEAPAETRSW